MNICSMKIEILDSKKQIGLLLLKGVWLCSLVGLAIALFMVIQCYVTGETGEVLGKQLFYTKIGFVASTLLGVAMIFTRRYVNKAVLQVIRFTGIFYGICLGRLTKDMSNRHSGGMAWSDLTVEWYNVVAISIVIIVVLFTYHWVYIRVRRETV